MLTRTTLKTLQIISKISIILSVIFILSACASKKYSRIGSKYEQAEMYKLAIDNYVISLKRKDKNNDVARIGLIRSAKRYADELEQKIDDAYKTLQDNEVVSSYLEIQRISKIATDYSLDVSISPKATGQFEEAKIRHLRNLYTKAQAMLDSERFGDAENYLNEIIQVDKKYERAAELYNFARCEPIYRNAKQMFQSKLYRSSYYLFEKLLSVNSQYKDAAALHKEAMQYAMLTIAIQPPVNYRNFPYLAGYIDESVKYAFARKANPLLKIVSPDYTQQMLNEQRLALNNNLPFDASLVIPVRVYLVGNIISSHYSTSMLQTVKKQAYLATEDQFKRVQFKKIDYTENNQTAQAIIQYKYELIRVENSTLIAFNKIEKSYSDEIKYASSNYDVSDLYPFAVRQGKKDTIYTDSSNTSSFRSLFRARKVLNDRSLYEKEFSNIVADDVYTKMNLYNPEK
ncbi:hypothetical protein MASR2M117_14160 [Paludibacter sp.]